MTSMKGTIRISWEKEEIDTHFEGNRMKKRFGGDDEVAGDLGGGEEGVEKQRPMVRRIAITTAVLAGSLLLSARAQDRGVKVFEQVSGAVAWVESISTDTLHQYRGSGVVLKAQGLLITNFHVYKSGGTLSARLGDTPLRLGNILCADKARDVLVVNVLGTTPAAAWNAVPVLSIINSDALRPGMDAYAIGNPRGVELTIAHGLVSGVRPNTKDTAQKLVQFSAPISEGNSGGALVDARGGLIGIPTVWYSDGGGQALNFAIPMERVMDAAAEGRNDLPLADERWLRTWRRWRMGECATVLDTLSLLVAENGPNSLTAAYLVARCFQRSGDLKNARTAYESLLASDPTHAYATWRLGEVFHTAGDKLAGMEQQVRAVRLDDRLRNGPPRY